MTGLPPLTALDLELEQNWLTVWFNQPGQRNPLSAERAGDLATLCGAIGKRRDIRGVTFRGRGGTFCAGGDLKAFQAIFQGSSDREATLAMSRDAGQLFDAINQLPQVTIMAIEGACVAGGMGLACTGDILIAEEDAKFALTETTLGLTPAQIAPFVLSRLGLSAARRLMLTGAYLDAAKALSVGLIDEVHSGDAFDAAIAKWKGQVLRCGVEAVATTKHLIHRIPLLNRQQQIELAAQSFADRILSEEGREGISAFATKRKPNWTT